MKYRLLPKAALDLEEALDWYSDIDPQLADDFLIEYGNAVQRILEFPKMWHKLDSTTRRCSLKRFPFGIIYRIEDDTAIAIAVGHFSRRPNYWQ